MSVLLTLVLQIVVILALARALGWMLRKLHQPQIIGEMLAGIILGPSLLGWVAPGLSRALFPTESLGILDALSQIGLLLFMFLVGLELDPRSLRGRGRATAGISLASIAAPFGLGALLAVYLFPRLAAQGVSSLNFALFMGAAMCITAFPVLARILSERDLLQTTIGTIAVACAAVVDVVGWIILALVVLLVRTTDQSASPLVMVLGIVGYGLVMGFAVRPVLMRWQPRFLSRGRISQDMVAIVLLVMLASSLVTEWLGIHALFGAFVAGIVMPKNRDMIRAIEGKFNDAAVVLLLPLFFAISGLRTSIGLVSGTEMWLYTLLIFFVAVVGKVGGAAVAARTANLSWRESGTIGVLMNTRGLLELVILSIGLDLGVLTPALYAMMVLMALGTTFMTAPLLEWIYFGRLRPGRYGPEQETLEIEIPSPEALN